MEDEREEPQAAHDMGLSWESYIRAAPEQIWEALTNPIWTRRWFFRLSATSSWVAGSSVIYRDDRGEAVIQGEVVQAEPYRRLILTQRFLVHPLAGGERPARVSWEIEPDGPICRLSLTAYGADGETMTTRLVAAGAAILLGQLKALLETGKVPPVDTVTFDCGDPWRLATFWETVTGYVLHDAGDGGAQLVDPTGIGPRLKFNRGAEPKTGKNRLHLDIGVEDMGGMAERLEALGGRVLVTFPDHIVLADPEDNEFCIR